MIPSYFLVHFFIYCSKEILKHFNTDNNYKIWNDYVVVNIFSLDIFIFYIRIIYRL